MTSVYFTFESIHSLRQTFAGRIGSADECTSALGHVTVGFSWLEQSLEKHIATLAQVPSATASALTAELSFKNKVAVLSSLVRADPNRFQFNVGREDPLAVWNDFVKMLYTCEEMRNQLLHSHWEPLSTTNIRRTKTSAKAAHGVRVVSQDLDAGYLLDVYDYILAVDFKLDEFFNLEA